MTSISLPVQVSRAAFAVIVVIIAMIDLWSKAAMTTWLAPNRRTIEVMPFLNLRLAHNPGISFGLLPAESDFARSLLIGFALLATTFVLWLGLRSQSGVERFGFGLIAGGAIGNVIDRSGDGFVTDFLDLHAFGWHWPTFNLADIAISSGVLALLLAMVFAERCNQPTQDQH